MPPPLPAPISAVELFRKLLSMSPAEQEAALASRPPEKRAIIESKLQEYLRLNPEEREDRLRTWRLRVMVRHLIRLPSSNRVDQLVSLPAADRQLVEARLKEWDQMPDDLRQAVLENEWAIRILVRSDALAPARPTRTPAEEEEHIARWQALPAAKRQEVLGQFQRFMDDLSEKEKSRVLNTLSAEEREQLGKTLEAFSRLAKPQRELCLTNLQKFAALTQFERQQFFNNANWWEGMTPQEREIWRKFVNRISARPQPPPPLPSAPAGSSR